LVEVFSSSSSIFLQGGGMIHHYPSPPPHHITNLFLIISKPKMKALTFVISEKKAFPHLHHVIFLPSALIGHSQTELMTPAMLSHPTS
jgi:hypothetical protein